MNKEMDGYAGDCGRPTSLISTNYIWKEKYDFMIETIGLTF